MIVLLHVLIALSSIAYTTYLIFSPSQSKLRISYALVAGTLVSGTYLVWLHPANLLQSCLIGLVYTCIVTGGIAIVQRRLITVADSSD